MKKIIFSVLAAILVLSTVSCSQTQVYGQELKSDKKYDTSPEVSFSDFETLVDGNNEFALELYRQLSDGDDGNLFFSPYSLSVALAMTYAGAEGATREQMAETLNFILEEEDLHAAFNKLAIELAKRGEGNKSEDEEGFKLNVVNAIWGQVEYEFLSDYLDTLAVNYDAGLRLLDFVSDPEACRRTINEWVSEQTEGKIEDLIKEGIISELTRLVLTNAIYFNAAWDKPFDEDKTSDGIFYLPDGTTVTVPMMHQTEDFGYTEGDGYQAVELKYDGNELSMLIILPEDGNFEQFKATFDAQRLDGIVENIRTATVTLSMPKFEYSSQFSVKDALVTMGMKDAFSMVADLSGIDGSYDLFIEDVVHKAYVSVDEAGTEAAAASAVIINLKGILEQAEVNLDHPFIYLIRDIETNTILFVGRVMNPEA
jgi:serpin B